MVEISSKQTGKNLGANIAYFIINVLIGIFLTPYFIDTLGISAFALIPLATSLIGYVGIITGSLNEAVSRHLTIDVHNPDTKLANRTFNSAFFGFSKVILGMIPLVLIISYLAPSLFSVPTEDSIDAMMLFIGIFLAFLIRAWSSSFTVTLFASNRLDLINLINATNIITQIISIITIFTFFSPSLMGVGISYLIGAILATILAILIFRRINKELEIKYSYYDSRKFREMAEMGGWIIVDSIGTLLLLNIDLIVVNYLYGNTVGGEYAIALQWSTLLKGISSTFVTVLGPIILITYANKKTERILTITKSSIKIMGIGLALPIGLLCGLAPLILSIWVGEEYAYLSTLIILLTSHLVINLALIPLSQIQWAYNRVRVPALVTIIAGVLNVFLAFAFASFFGLGIYGVALAGLIVLTSKNFIFNPIYASIILDLPKLTFYPALIPGAVATLGIAVISSLLSVFIPMGDLIGLIVIAGGIAAIYLLFSWKFLLTKNEKSMLPL
jgi:O-antigen/teichoic acid export membrane protein